MNFFELLKSANHNLFRNKVRTLLTIIAIFVGSFTIILNVAINSGVNSFIDEQTDALGGDNFIMLMSDEATSAMGGTGMGTNGGPTEYIDSKTVAAETSLSEEDLEKLKKIDGINGDSFYSPTPMGGEGYFASSKTDKKYAIQGLMILPPGNFKIPLAAGRLPDDSKNTYQITLEPEYAKALGYDSDEDIIGQTITVGIKNDVLDTWTDIPVEVVGVEANGIVSSSLGAIMSRALYNKIFDVTYQHLPSSYKDSLPTYYVMATFDNERFTEDEIKQSVADALLSGMVKSPMRRHFSSSLWKRRMPPLWRTLRTLPSSRKLRKMTLPMLRATKTPTSRSRSLTKKRAKRFTTA